MNVNLHIERLIIEGLPVASSQGTRVRTAVEGELARMVAELGVPEQWRVGGAVPRVIAQDFTLASGERPDAIGRNIARSIYRGTGGAT